MDSDHRFGREEGLVPRDADPRRGHLAWEVLAERQRDLCEGLAALAATWGAVKVRHELELAVAVTDICRRVDTLLGEYL